jgi:hypothetical protein
VLKNNASQKSALKNNARQQSALKSATLRRVTLYFSALKASIFSLVKENYPLLYSGTTFRNFVNCAFQYKTDQKIAFYLEWRIIQVSKDNSSIFPKSLYVY